MSSQNTPLKSGIRDNLRRGTVYEFLAQEIKNGSVLSIVSAYFTINVFEALQKPLNEIENLRFLFGDPDFIKSLDPTNTEKKAFRITDTGLELHKQLQQKLFEADAFDKANTDSFLFCAVEVKDNTYSRTQYAEFTREINKRLLAPTVVLFRAADRLTIGFTDRRPHKTKEDRDVLGQVTLIKEVSQPPQRNLRLMH